MQAPNNSPASPATSACSPATAAEPQGGAPADCPSPQEQIQTEKRFINDAAHQLRTPLAGIISQAELALQETDLQQLHQRVRKIHAAAQRGAQIVRQMLALARSEDRSAHNRSPETYDLAELAREVTREWIPKSLTLDKDLGYEGLHTAMVRGNRFMMREAISNLIDNALSYTPTNAVITVSVRYGAAQGTAAAHAAKPAQAAAPRIVAISGDLDNRGKAEQTAQQPAAHTAWQAMPPRQEDGQTPAPAAQAPIASQLPPSSSKWPTTARA